MSKRAGIVVVSALVIAAAIWGYSAYTTRSLRTSIAAMVNDASVKLRPALIAYTDAKQDFEADARTLEAQVTRLRAMRTGAVVGLADAADSYLVSAREIVRRRAAMERTRDAHEASLGALRQHLASDRGSAAWTAQAVTLKTAVDRDLREFRIASESYASLVGSLPQAHARIKPHVQGAWLADDETIARARAHALDALARTDENTRQATRLDTYRGRARPANRGRTHER